MLLSLKNWAPLYCCQALDLVGITAHHCHHMMAFVLSRERDATVLGRDPGPPCPPGFTGLSSIGGSDKATLMVFCFKGGCP